MFCSDFHLKLNRFRSDEKYCDVIVKVQGKKFPCHRVVLAASSEYFHTIFSSSSFNVHEIALEDIDVETFQTVVEFLYGRPECERIVQNHNLQNLIRASLFYGIPSIEKSCLNFILKKGSKIPDLIDLFMLVRSLNIASMIDVLSSNVLCKLPSFFYDEKFLEMSFDDLKVILIRGTESRFNWPLEYEQHLFTLLIHWVLHSPLEERVRKYFRDLIKIVDFERISTKSITFMLKYFEHFMSGLHGMSATTVASMIEESTLVGDDSYFADQLEIQDSKNRFLLKKKIAEYSVVIEPCLHPSGDEMTDPFVAPKFYEGEVGLHVYVGYNNDPKICGLYDCLKTASIFSMNKFKPEWTPSGQAKAWYPCNERCILSWEPFDLMYCLEVFGDIHLNNFRQSFCVYSSIDMNLPTSVLTPPPIPLKMGVRYLDINTYAKATQYGIFLYSPNRYYSFQKLNNHELYHYNCEVDKWSPLSQVPTNFRRFHHHLIVNDNLVYLLGGGPNKDVIALDYRTATWMEFPSNTICAPVKSCILNKKIYVSNGKDLETFDPIAFQWETLQKPEIPITSMIAYENMLWIIAQRQVEATSDCTSLPKNCISSIVWNPVSQDWNTEELLLDKVIQNYADELSESNNVPRHYFKYPNIKKVIVFKS